MVRDNLLLLVGEIRESQSVLERLQGLYEFDYDWRRLDYLRLVYDQVRPLIGADLQEYFDFLLALADSKELG
jgi:hypothetical protein